MYAYVGVCVYVYMYVYVYVYAYVCMHACVYVCVIEGYPFMSASSRKYLEHLDVSVQQFRFSCSGIYVAGWSCAVERNYSFHIVNLAPIQVP